MSFALTIRCLFSYAAYFGAGVCLWQAQAAWEQQDATLRSEPDAWMDLLRTQLVVVDAGHGGHDGGTQGYGTLEKQCSLQIARRLDALLRAQGIRTIMTRGNDTFVELEERSAIANRNKASLFISVHLNADATSTETAGVETYYSTKKRLGDLVKLRDQFDIPPSQRLKDGRSERLAQIVQRAVCAATGANDRRARDSNYLVVTQTECPAVLVECGYLTNEPEAKLLATEGYQEKIATALAGCVRNFLLASSVNPRRGLVLETVASATSTGVLRSEVNP